MPAQGRLDGDAVVVDEEREAGALFAKGAYGAPLSGGALRLTIVEAAYLVGEGRLAVRAPGGAPLGAGDLVAAGAGREAGFEVLYLVHRELRGRGLVAKQDGPGRFLVWPRGALPGKDAADGAVRVLSERAPVAPGALAREADAVAAAGRRLLAALADEEGDVTYYRVKLHDPKGQAGEPRPPAAPARAVALADRVLVPQPPGALAQAGYGREIGAGLQLPFLEALHLARQGFLAPEGGEEGLRARARAHDPEFDLKERVWRDLRGRGLLVKTGFKFGTHFRAYTKAAADEHAPYLVHAVPAEAAESAQKIAGFVRLAHAVRKALLFALVEDSADAPVRYVALERTRP